GIGERVLEGHGSRQLRNQQGRISPRHAGRPSTHSSRPLRSERPEVSGVGEALVGLPTPQAGYTASIYSAGALRATFHPRAVQSAAVPVPRPTSGVPIHAPPRSLHFF